MFFCERCGYGTDFKGNLKIHLKRLTVCQPVLKDVEPATLLAVLNAPKPKCQCEWCHKTFSSNQSKHLHKKNHCKAKPEAHDIKELKDIVLSLQEQIKNTQVANQITNIHYNNSNIQNNSVTINAYGNESTDHISGLFLDQCVKRTNKGLVELLGRIHYAATKPENANIRISNKKTSFIEYNDGDKWVYEKKKKLLNDLVEKGHDMMQNHLDDNEERLASKWNETLYEHIKKWMEDVHYKDKSAMTELLEDVYLLILNNSK